MKIEIEQSRGEGIVFWVYIVYEQLLRLFDLFNFRFREVRDARVNHEAP